MTVSETHPSLARATDSNVYGDAADPYGRAFAIGSVAGMRAALAPAAVHLEARDRVFVALALAAAGELVGDKLPATPSRLSPPALVARVASGAYCGRALAVRFGGEALAGALAGALGALASAFVSYGTRAALTGGAGLPDLPVAVAEDAIAIATAVNAQRRPPDLTLS